MHGNDAIFLRPARGAGQGPAASASVDPNALYGCVDWYLYHESAPAMRAAAGAQESGEPAARSPAIRAAGAQHG